MKHSGRAEPMRIKKLELWNFKAFERFTMTLGTNAFLVGPNNARELRHSEIPDEMRNWLIEVDSSIRR